LISSLRMVNDLSSIRICSAPCSGLFLLNCTMKIRISEEAKLLRIPQMPLIFRDFSDCVFLPVAFRGNFAIIMNRDSFIQERGNP